MKDLVVTSEESVFSVLKNGTAKQFTSQQKIFTIVLFHESLKGKTGVIVLQNAQELKTHLLDLPRICVVER